jgi:putative aminopeptidase FrvX
LAPETVDSRIRVSLGDPGADLLGTCRALTAVAAPSGNEDRLTAAVADHLRDRGLEPIVDRLGQVAVELGARADGPVALVTAHLDELGLVTRAVDADGMLRVHRLGGVPERVLPGTRVVVHTGDGDLPGVVGVKSHHLTPVEERHVVVPMSDLYVDVGGRASGVRVGDPITFEAAWQELEGGRFSAKALDDRLGVAALLACVDRLLDSPPPLGVVAAFTTQEEFHLRGGLALVARFAPDIVVNVDVAPAGDTPDLAGASPVRLGGGPSLSRYNFHGRGTLGGLIPHPALVRAVERAAGDAGISLQYDATVGVITDAAFLPMATAEGIAAVDIGIPCRYLHSPVETAQLSDVVATADLLGAVLPLLADADLTRGHSQIDGGGLA